MHTRTQIVLVHNELHLQNHGMCFHGTIGNVTQYLQQAYLSMGISNNVSAIIVKIFKIIEYLSQLFVIPSV